MSKTKISLSNATILVTGSPGFIGAALVQRLLKEMPGGTVISFDNMNDYYDPALKAYRLQQIEKAAESSKAKHIFVKGSIADKDLVDSVFRKYRPEIVVNLAAQAGVRYSIEHPEAYIESNIVGFFNILEACRHSYDNDMPGIQHLVYASSSSVYGGNKKVPFSVEDMVDHPVSLYAATKKSDELLAHSYAKLYNIPCTGLRFFTVYGPAGRPDMFYFSAADTLRKNGIIKIFNYGNCMRDFTYIDDIVEGVFRVMQGAPERTVGDDGLPVPPYAVYNIGGGKPENLLEFVDVLHESLLDAGVLPYDFDFSEHTQLVGMQPGDVPVTFADSSALEHDYGFTPQTGIRDGLKAFAEWYADYQEVREPHSGASEALKATLKHFKVYPGRYMLGGTGDDVTCLWYRNGHWSTSFFEHGRVMSLRSFEDAYSANRDIIDRLFAKEETGDAVRYYNSYYISHLGTPSAEARECLDALIKTLQAYHVMTGEYGIGKIKDDAVCLWEDAGDWLTCYYERGDFVDVKSFHSLADACEDMIWRLGDPDDLGVMIQYFRSSCSANRL